MRVHEDKNWDIEFLRDPLKRIKVSYRIRHMRAPKVDDAPG